MKEKEQNQLISKMLNEILADATEKQNESLRKKGLLSFFCSSEKELTEVAEHVGYMRGLATASTIISNHLIK